ncbi:hypothetical protein, partial [Methanoculleus sp.]|uniref:hypothetical protein n=1 Tax=Methanoculleus sp. TaxID=90427 RepID=UPI002C0BB6FC
MRGKFSRIADFAKVTGCGAVTLAIRTPFIDERGTGSRAQPHRHDRARGPGQWRGDEGVTQTWMPARASASLMETSS